MTTDKIQPQIQSFEVADGDTFGDILSKNRIRSGRKLKIGLFSIKEYRNALPDVILAGNIHPIKVMIEGTPDDVKAAVRYCFDTAASDGKFILVSGGAMAAGSKPENVDAFIESAYEITKY